MYIMYAMSAWQYNRIENEMETNNISVPYGKYFIK